MKTLLLSAALLVISSTSFAANIECKATDVYGGPLEESFSVEEYPEVSISPAEVSIGSSSYSKSDGVSITIKKSPAKTSVVVVTKDQSEQFNIVINNKTKKGTVSYNTADTSEDMADIVCK